MAFLIGNQRTASINCSYMDFTILYLSPCQIDADWVGNITTLLLLLLSVRVRHFANFSTFSSTHFKTASRTASFTPSQLFYFITNSLTLIIHFFCQLLLFIFQLCHIPKNKINFVTFVTLDPSVDIWATRCWDYKHLVTRIMSKVQQAPYHSALAIEAGPYQSPALRPDSRPIAISFCIEKGISGFIVSPK